LYAQSDGVQAQRESGKLGKKAPAITARWGKVVTYDAEGNVISVEPPKPEPKPRKRRRRRR
jgi:hypothetical protein